MTGTVSDRDDPARLDSLTGLRTLAAAMVLVSHLRWFVPNAEWAQIGRLTINTHGFLQQGDVGVSCFFVLSGFVLAWSRRGDDSAGRFYGRRFARIWPLQAVTWGLWLVMIVAAIVPSTPPLPAAANLVFLSVWSPDPAWITAMNPPSWSLGAEAFFYLCFPVLIVTVTRLPARWTPVLAGGLVAAGIGVPVAAQVASSAGIVAEATAYWLTYIFPPVRFFEFALGAVLATWMHQERTGQGPRLPVPPLWVAVGAVALSYAAAGRAPRLVSNSAVTLVPWAMLIVALAGADLDRRRTVWSGRVMTHLGRVSFAVYLIQYPVIVVAAALWQGRTPVSLASVERAPAGWLVAAGAVVVILGAAEVLHRWVERPAERALRARLGGTRTLPARLTAP